MSDSLWDESRAEHYLKAYSDPRKKIGTQSLLCKNVADTIPTGSIMDFGCGMGHIIPHLKEGVPYIGFDYSPVMLKYLEDFFPGVTTVQGDATLPYDEFKEYLQEVDVPVHSDYSVSTSLIIHIPTVPGVKALLKNMWETCTKGMIFGVETASNKKVTTVDGLTLRNISVNNVIGLLKELDIPMEDIAYEHQKATYRQFYTFYPMEDAAVVTDTPKLHTRTTIFSVRKT
jgi:SAM-dependent methyltransferase